MNKTVLDCLRDAIGKWLTAGELIRRTSLTNAGLHQELRRIRQVGYIVDYSPRQGYRLTAIPDRLIPDEIQRGLHTRIVGREILTYEEVDSTMLVAEELAEAGARDGTTVFAERQRKGRGRTGHQWYCPKYKGILMTTILRPRLRMDRICLLAGMVAIAATEAVRDTQELHAYIKWPNDIIINNKKVCGILVEAITPRGKQPYFLAGIGLNANLTKRELPRDVIYPATSLLIEKGVHVERIKLSQALLERLDRWYTRLREGDNRSIRRRWSELFPLIGHRARLLERNKEYVGKIIDLSVQGGLIVELDNGSRKFLRGEYLEIKDAFP